MKITLKINGQHYRFAWSSWVVCLFCHVSGLWADAAVTWGPFRAGGQCSPPGLHPCLCCLDNRIGHPANFTHSFSLGTYREATYGTCLRLYSLQSGHVGPAYACHLQVFISSTPISCAILFLLSSLLSALFRLPVHPFFRSKESMVWMNTSFTCSCQPCSLSSRLCLP